MECARALHSKPNARKTRLFKWYRIVFVYRRGKRKKMECSCVRDSFLLFICCAHEQYRRPLKINSTVNGIARFDFVTSVCVWLYFDGHTIIMDHAKRVWSCLWHLRKSSFSSSFRSFEEVAQGAHTYEAHEIKSNHHLTVCCIIPSSTFCDFIRIRRVNIPDDRHQRIQSFSYSPDARRTNEKKTAINSVCYLLFSFLLRSVGLRSLPCEPVERRRSERKKEIKVNERTSDSKVGVWRPWSTRIA